MTERHIEDSSAPLIERLATLRTRLMWCVGGLVVAILAFFPIAEHIFEFLTAPACHAFAERGRDCDFIVTGTHQIFFTYVKVSIFAGFCLSFPVIAIQLWRFIAPGLYTAEQSAVLPFLLATPALFACGAAFAYYAAMPLAMDFFLSFEKPVEADGGQLNLQVLPTADEYLGITMKFILAFGICFELPVALTLMGKAGLVGAEGLRRNRKDAVGIILIVAAVATPPDVFSQILLFTVVYSLYEVSIHLVKTVEKKREKELRAQGYTDEDFEEGDDDEENGDDGEAEEGDGEAAEDRNDRAEPRT